MYVYKILNQVDAVLWMLYFLRDLASSNKHLHLPLGYYVSRYNQSNKRTD